MKLILPIYYTFKATKKKPSKTILVGMNWYRNAHFTQQNEVKHYYHTIIGDRLNTLSVCEKYNMINLAYHIFVKKNNTDGGNVRSLIEKFTLDALVEHGVIVNDTVEYVKADRANYHIDKDNPRAEIEIFSQLTE